MSKRTKIMLGGLVILAAFLIASMIQALKGTDASKKDPRELFVHYVQKPIPQGIPVQSAVGHANFGGTSITFRLKLAGEDLDELIASKGLRKHASLQKYAFPDQDLAVMRQPEFYLTDKDVTWSRLGTTVMMAADRDAGIAFYKVFSP